MRNNKEYRVSVIVTVYNTEQFLRQCLDSIVNQTLYEIEIICINDGSTDGSIEIIKEFALYDRRICVYNKENEGLGGASARNLGLEKAQGEYISILDSDDFFELDMLKKAADKADLTNADIVVFGGYEFDNENGNTNIAMSILNEKAIPNKEIFSYLDCKEDIYQLSQGMAWNKLYRRTFLDKHNLQFQSIKYTDDAYFTFANMVLAERITVLNEYLCYYRVNTHSNQTAGLANYPDSAYLPYVALKDSLIKWGIYDSVKRSFINCAISFFRYFYDKIDRYEPFKYLHDKYRNDIFDAFDICGQKPDFFYDRRIFQWIAQVAKNSAEELAFKSARAYGGDTTTGVLRFKFPYDLIPRKCKIAIIGAGIMGKHYYSQVILSSYCDVVLWVEKANPTKTSYIHSYEEMKNTEFDFAIIAYAQSDLIDYAVTYLGDIGVTKEKIILGGM